MDFVKKMAEGKAMNVGADFVACFKKSHGVLKGNHDVANAFPSVDQDAIAFTVSSIVLNCYGTLFQDRCSFSVASDGIAPDMPSAVFDERIEIWTTEFDATFPQDAQT